MKRLCVYYQSGDNFAFMAGTSIVSLMVHANTDIFYDIYLASADLSVENKDKLQSILSAFPDVHAKLTFIDASAYEKQVRDWNLPAHRNSYVTYYKLFIDRFFKGTDVDRIIELGTDTLVTGDLSGLIDFDMQGHPIAMNWSEKLYERRFRRSQKYCVAEMILVDLKEWRAHDCERRIFKRIRKYGDIYGSKDQGFLNMEFQNEMAQLPLKYNIYGITFYFSMRNKIRFNNAPVMTKEEIAEAYRNPEIIHIPQTFLYRPHETNSRHPLKKMWWHYCRLPQNPWRDMKPYPEPHLGTKERFLRFIYLHVPKQLAEWIFIIFRHGYGFMNSVLYPYQARYRTDVKQIYN